MATILGSTNSSLWTFKLEVSEGTYSVANNTSPVTVKAYIGRSSNSGSYMYGADIDITIGCTGVSPKTVNYRNTGRVDIAANGWLLVGTVTFSAVPHNDDGGKEVKVTGEFSNPGVSPSSGSASGWVTLATIPRKAELLTWPASWTDEDSPTITYSNPAGSAVDDLQACIAWSDTDVVVAYKPLVKTEKSFTFALTASEKEALQKGVLNGSTSRGVKFFVRTTLGDSVYWSSNDVSKSTITIANCKPTLSPTVKDTNSKTVALTGSDQTIVKYASVVTVATGAKALKHASFVSQAIICGGTDVLYGASKTIENPQSGLFEIVAKDNRGQTVESGKILKPFIEYINLTCSQSVRISLDTADETSSIANLTISGSYFDGSFGAADNTLSLWYRYKVNDGTDWSTLEQDGWREVEETVTVADGTYTVTIPIAGLDYSKQYIFQSMAEDKLGNVQTREYAVKTQPAFDWGESDFNFNVPVTVMGSPITPKANRYIYSTPGVAGSAGYIKIARLTHRKANADTPITFVFTRRLEASPMTVHVQFKSNSATTNPDLKNITYEGSNYGAFIVRVAESVWDLYVQKVSAYDTVTLHTWFSSGTVEDRLAVEFPGELVSSLPTGLDNKGYYRATPLVPKSVLDCFMPVGYVLILHDDHLENEEKMDPNVMYPGTTWLRIENRFLWATTSTGKIGKEGGESTHTLTVDELPKHTHSIKVAHEPTGSNTLPGPQPIYRNTGATTNYLGSVATEIAGGGAAHNNMPPYIQVSVWRRTA